MEKRSENAVAIGNFDGFHLGHQKILKHTLNLSSELRLGKLLVTFHPNPRVFFGSEDKLIFSENKKSRFLATIGLDRIVFVDFNKVFDMTGNDFVDRYLLSDLNMRRLVVGENFRLGKGREWNTRKLSEYGREKGFAVDVVPSEYFGDEKISSSLIRSLLRKADLGKAGKMLGKLYSMEGEVEPGNQIGRKLGFPTINVVNDNCLLPDGVYMTRVIVEGEKYSGATYIGSKTASGENKRKIETHIFNFQRDVYGSTVEIEFLSFRRAGKTFETESDLVAQIEKDIESIKFDFKNQVW